MTPTPEAFVRSALARLGIDQRTSGYWTHDVMTTLVESLPRCLVTPIVFKEMKTIKAKALKKKEKQK